MPRWILAATAAVLALTGLSRTGIPISEGYVDGAGGVRLFYRRIGHGPRTVIFLHGGPGSNLEGGGPDLEPLAGAGSLILYDQRGGGRSELVKDPKLLTAEEHVRDLEAIRRAFGLEQVSLVGLSWGAGLAALYAAEHPARVERLLLLSPMPPARSPFANDRLEALGAHLDARRERRLIAADQFATASDAELPDLCRQLDDIGSELKFGEERTRWTRGDVCRYAPDALRNQWRARSATLQSLGDWDFRPVLRRLPMPILVVEGEKTNLPLRGTREWVAAAPRARLLLVPDTGPFLVEHPEAFLASARGFLSGDPAAPPTPPPPGRSGP